MSRAVAVVISDIHYDLSTLPLADAALRQAVSKANELKIPLIVAGDLHNTKANMRGECVNAMIKTFKRCDIFPFVIVGNHCRLNEKSWEHSLNFLEHYAYIMDSPLYVRQVESWMLPYFNDPEQLRKTLSTIPAGSRIIMHQGVVDSNSGHYIQDHSALNKNDFADFRVISGHYHTSQDIKCGRPRKGAVGLFTYIGNPYTLNFGEANDPPKGFAVLYADGLLERVPTNLRRHVIIEYSAELLIHDLCVAGTKPFLRLDLYWLKVKGTRSQLAGLQKQVIGQRLFGHTNFKLDLIPTDAPTLEAKTEKMTGGEILDALIDNEPESDEEKRRLKDLWREVVG